MEHTDKPGPSAGPSQERRDPPEPTAGNGRPGMGPAGPTTTTPAPGDSPDAEPDDLAGRLANVTISSDDSAASNDAAANMDDPRSRESVDSEETETDSDTATLVDQDAQERDAARQEIIEGIMRSLRIKLGSKIDKVIAASKAAKPEAEAPKLKLEAQKQKATALEPEPKVEVTAKEEKKKEAIPTETQFALEEAEAEDVEEIVAEELTPSRSSTMDSAASKGKERKFKLFAKKVFLSRKRSSSPSSTLSAGAPPSISAGPTPPPPPPAAAPASSSARFRFSSRRESEPTERRDTGRPQARERTIAPAPAPVPQTQRLARALVAAPATPAAPGASLDAARGSGFLMEPQLPAFSAPISPPAIQPPAPRPLPDVRPAVEIHPPTQPPTMYTRGEIPPPMQPQPGPGVFSTFSNEAALAASHDYPDAFFMSSTSGIPGGQQLPSQHIPLGGGGLLGMPGLPGPLIDEDFQARIGSLNQSQQEELSRMIAAEQANPLMPPVPVIAPMGLGSFPGLGPLSALGLPHHALMRQGVELQEPGYDQHGQVSSPGVGEQSGESMGTPDTHGAKHAQSWDEDVASDHDGRRKKPRRVGTEKGTGGPSKKFACPFFKRNRKKYSKWTSCPGPGWDEVHRVKTHLYRRHALPIQCPRCWEVFKEEKLLSSHLQQNPPCISRENHTLVEGFTKDQEKKLRSRKKAQADTTDEDKWREIYMILFPDDDPASIPSPYYDAIEVEDGNSPRTGELEDYATFIKREMPTLVRRELENLLQDEFQDIAEHLRPQVANIVLKLQPRLLGLYKQSQMPLSEYGPSSDSNDTSLTPALSQRTGDTGSTPVTEGGVPTTDSFRFDENAMFDFDVSNLGVGTWDYGDELSAQEPEYTTAGAGFSWDYEFDKLINPGLFLPQGNRTATTYMQNSAQPRGTGETWQQSGYPG